MFRKLSLLIALIFTVGFTSAATAQEATPSGLEDIDGLESGYGRMYMVDYEALLASPEALEAITAGEEPLVGIVGVFTFEDESAAGDAMGQFGEEFTGEFFEGAEVEEVEVKDLGDAANGYTGEATVDEEMMAETSVVVVQEDERIYLAVVVGGEDTLAMSESWVGFMLDGEVSEDEVVLNEDGTSTGGVFAVMPGEGDEILGGLLPFSDFDFSEMDNEGL